MNREIESFFNKLNDVTNNLENKKQEEEIRIQEKERKIKELSNRTKKDLDQLGVYKIFKKIRNNNILTLEESYTKYGVGYNYVPCEIEFYHCEDGSYLGKHGYRLSINRYTTWNDGQAYWSHNSIRVLKDKEENYYVGYKGEDDYLKQKKVKRNEVLDTLFDVVTLCKTYKEHELKNHLNSFFK
ncbi:MAG: hypothetical protein PHO75_02145 [Candidatus Shapirobacteria bacterium]|nr:hypothetical protein [Candidatus Shapirobacteria bacterium]